MPSRPVSCGRVIAALAVYAVGACPAALAQTRDVEPRLSVRVGAATTDNLGRGPAADAQSETFLTTGIDIGFLRETSRARAYADGTIDYFAYNSEEFSNETGGAIDTGLDLHVVPETLSWEFSERVDHARRDPFTPVGPGNFERINVFATGPRLVIPLGASSSFRLDGQYAERHYQESESLDGPIRAVSLQFARDLSQFQQLALVATGQEIDFDDPRSRPYEIQHTYLAYERRTAAEGLLALSAGTSRLRSEDETRSEPYFQMEWTRDITPRSALSFHGGRRLESPTDYFDSATLDSYDTGGVDDSLLSADPHVDTDARLTYTLTRPRAVFRATRELSRERYEDRTFPEREVSESAVGVDYRFTPLLLGTILLAGSREDFDVRGTAKEERARASLQRRLGRSWEGSLSFEYNSRDYDIGSSYHERRYILSIAWRPPRDAR